MISNFISSNVKNTRMILHIDNIISYINYINYYKLII